MTEWLNRSFPGDRTYGLARVRWVGAERKRAVVATAVVLAGLFRLIDGSNAASANPITPGELRAHVDVLTAKPMAGRLTGTEGAQMAAAYIADQFAQAGLDAPQGTYLHPFDFAAGVSLGADNVLTVRGADVAPVLGQQWTPLAFSKSGSVPAAPVVFAGYGMVAAGGAQYDSFQDADLSGKWVLVWRGVPVDAPVETRVELARFADLRYKASLVKARGAIGLIVAPAPGVTYASDLPSIRFDASFGRAEMPVIAVNQHLSDQMLATIGAERAALQTRTAAGETSAPIPLDGVEISARISLSLDRRKGFNVLGLLDLGAPSDSVPLIIGAHFDHLGHGETSGSLAQGDEDGLIHPGADDNASGIAALLEIADSLAASDLTAPRNILFAAWSGEELGLLGSYDFVQRNTASAYLNMDMVGRLRQQVHVAGFASSPDWDGIVSRALAGSETGRDTGSSIGATSAPELNVDRIDTPFVPTDATSFYSAGVPVLSFTTGAHIEYHSPRDTADSLNYPGLAAVAGLVRDIAVATVMTPQKLAYVPDVAAPPRPGRRRAGVTLGTIPQYAGEDQRGVAIADTVADGPAQRAGIMGGDVIVGLADADVADIYDFMRILNGLKPDEAVSLIVDREGREVALEIVPTARSDQ